MKRFGTITPSSNVVVEQVTQAIVADHPEVVAHFARLSHHGTHDPFPDSYDMKGMESAAELLAHARLDQLCWNGTKGGAIGFDLDRDLCRRMTAQTDIPMVTSTLALDEVLRATGAVRLGFVTPYAPEFLKRLSDGWAAAGYEISAKVGAGLSDNFAYSTVAPTRLFELAQEVAATKPDAIIFSCTNMLGAPLCAALEADLGIPVYDSVSVAVWRCLRDLNVDTAPSQARWGSLFGRA